MVNGEDCRHQSTSATSTKTSRLAGTLARHTAYCLPIPDYRFPLPYFCILHYYFCIMFPTFLRILSLFLMMGAGFALRKSGRVDTQFSKKLSVTLMSVFYPCMIFTALSFSLSLTELSRLWVLPVGAASIMVLGLLVTRAAMPPFMKDSPVPERRTIFFSGLINNFSFLPIILVTSLWDERAVALVIFAALGVEITVWTLGVETLTGSPMRLSSLRNLLTVPMVAIALALAVLVLKHLGLAAQVYYHPTLFPVAETVKDTMVAIGRATIPTSAIVCGIRMADVPWKNIVLPRVLIFNALRLLVIPGIAIGILCLLPIATETRNILIVIATMPVAMASVVMSEIYDAAPSLASTLVLSSHIYCLATIPFWLHLVGLV